MLLLPRFAHSRVQHRFGGMRDGTLNRGGMRDTKEIRSGMWDEIILSGLGYVVFHGRDAGCFEIDGGIEDHKNHFMTEKNTE